MNTTHQIGTRGELSYVLRGNARPISYTYPPPAGQAWETGEFEPRTVEIRSARPIAPGSLDRTGFELFDAPTAVKDFDDTDAVLTSYRAEMAELALQATGASRALVFDHLIRRRRPKDELNFGRVGDDGIPTANGRIHNDYTEASGRYRLEKVLKDSSLVGSIGRYAIVNLWRSIRGPVFDAPLAVCDASTIVIRDLVEAELRYPRRTGEIYLFAHSTAHRWYYYPEMQPDEVLVFKQFDSQISGTARLTPHTAFQPIDAPSDVPPRVSIEVRCLLIFD
jgi:hypothetical protein